ncbi:hypothetical protein OH460_07705 [Vibrio sp. Makdt]|uniref:hypothetical protein n=1 Tax=Vibrio sp. Makdt TaxID=2998828 RepID=UPI0022CDB70D|nr:hypothetical protein [Vibrio sp. Makdt]MDA0152181.1 hypothetical protein [Vibrio sp. Makdt]
MKQLNLKYLGLCSLYLSPCFFNALAVLFNNKIYMWPVAFYLVGFIVFSWFKPSLTMILITFSAFITVGALPTPKELNLYIDWLAPEKVLIYVASIASLIAGLLKHMDDLTSD